MDSGSNFCRGNSGFAPREQPRRRVSPSPFLFHIRIDSTPCRTVVISCLLSYHHFCHDRKRDLFIVEWLSSVAFRRVNKSPVSLITSEYNGLVVPRTGFMQPLEPIQDMMSLSLITYAASSSAFGRRSFVIG